MNEKQTNINDYSEIRLRMKKTDIDTLKKEAETNGLKLNAYIRTLIDISRGGRVINTVATDDLLSYILAIQPAIDTMTESIKLLRSSQDFSPAIISQIEQDRKEVIKLMKEQLKQTIKNRKCLIRES